MPYIPRDTTPEAYEVQKRIFQEMGASRRAELCLEWSDFMRRVAMDGIRARNPHYTDRQVVLHYARMTLGEKLFEAAFGEEARALGMLE